MTAIGESGAALRCPPLSIHSANDEHVISQSPSTLQDNSATIYLLKKATSGLWGMMQNLSCDGYTTGRMNTQALAEVNVMLSSKISPYFYSAIETVRCMNDLGITYSSYTFALDDDDTPPMTSDVSDSSSCEQNLDTSDTSKSGLMFESDDFNKDESNEHLDYIITQVDVSRMARAVSRQLDVESIHNLPTITYHANQLICSSHEEKEEVNVDENVDEFLLRNAQIIEDYFDSPEDNVEVKFKKEDLNSGFSWMMVPNDPNEEDMTRMTNSNHSQEIPDSISICKSSDSVSLERNTNEEAFEHCAVCQEPFQDGECLRVLPCQHLFHSGCIDQWASREKSSVECVLSGCSMCKKAKLEAQSREEVSDQYFQESQVERVGTVPSWAFARLGNWTE